MQSGNYGHALADVDFSFNHDTGELTVDDARMLGVEDINACENPGDTIADIVVQAELDAGEAGKEVVATIDGDFLRATDEGAESGSNYGAESQLVNMIASAVRWSMSTNTANTADIGLMNAGGLHADLFSGDVTTPKLLKSSLSPVKIHLSPSRDQTSKMPLSSSGKKVLHDQWQHLAYPTTFPTPTTSTVQSVTASLP